MSIYCTEDMKIYETAITLANGGYVKTKVELYLQSPIGDRLVEIRSVDRYGAPSTVVVPLHVLREFIKEVGE